MATVEALLTAEEFGNRPDPGYPEELVRGRVITMPPPKPRHGKICGQAYYLLRLHADQHDLGQLLSNDSGVITERDPDTVRGADVAFYSYKRLPKGPIPPGYLAVAPDLIVEVRSPDDRWQHLLKRVNEYLAVGVTCVIVLDPEPRTAHVFHADRAPRQLGPEDELTIPDVLGDFQFTVARFFE
ncbi:MAG: Uma2 family endonuclease [Isosphaeraceae bacterium]